MSCITKQPSFLNVIFHCKCDLLVLKSVVVPYDNGRLENICYWKKWNLKKNYGKKEESKKLGCKIITYIFSCLWVLKKHKLEFPCS